VRVTCDGEEFTAWRAVAADAIELDVRIGDHAFVLHTGYRGGRPATQWRRTAASPPVVTGAGAAAAGGSLAAPSASAVAAVTSCRCC